MDEVDCIDVPANAEAANQTKILDIGPSVSAAALVTCHQLPPPLLWPLKPLFHPCPPLRTQPGLPCYPSLPFTSDLPRGLPMLNSSFAHTPPPLTTTHPWPCPIAPPRQLYQPLAFKHPTLSSCLPPQVIHNHLLPPLP